MLTQGISRAETIDPSTWAPSGSGAYFFDRSNETGNAITDFSEREQQLGRKFDGHLYYLENCDVTPSNLTDPHWSLAVDKVPFVVLSWCGGNNPDTIIPQIAAGDYDKDINDFAASVKSQLVPYGHVFIRPFWEFNYTGSEWNDIHYGGNASTFIAAWQRVVNLFRQDGLSDSQVKFIWSPSRTASSQSQNPVAYYPGSAYVDWIGIDAYPKNQFLTLQQMLTTGDGFDWYDTFKSDGKPLMVSETGIQPVSVYGNGSPTRAQWWSDLVSELEGPLSAIKAVEYFDSTPGGGWEFTAPSSAPSDSAAATLAAVKAAVNSCVLDVLSPACGTGSPTPAPGGSTAPTQHGKPGSAHPSRSRRGSAGHRSAHRRSSHQRRGQSSGGRSAGQRHGRSSGGQSSHQRRGQSSGGRSTNKRRGGSSGGRSVHTRRGRSGRRLSNFARPKHLLG